MPDSLLHPSHRFSVAPMLDWTDRHCRHFLRLLSSQTMLYTEMVTTGAIIFGKGDYLSFGQSEHPVVLQLGGSDPIAMAKCARIAQERGYDEININVGCPSDRVKNGSFGACLMSTPDIVASCILAMKQEVDIPITVKCRIGIDDMDEEQGLTDFVSPLVDVGLEHLIVHARKAWLQGLSPKENRDVPPLNYERVYRLKQEFSDVHMSINGGIKTLEQAKVHLQHVDGVMMGREVYSNPYLLSEVDAVLFGKTDATAVSRADVIESMSNYIREQHSQGVRVWHIARHTLGLFQGQPGGKIWRRYLSQNGTGKHNDPALLLRAYEQVLIAQEKAQTFSQNH
ncbi:tRNA dihydrouridine(20/20a) synthase DusA [Glaciecola siphonariae]|uniref:tRNA-dihydrouridine(20/20a) synthase n=1 Tax=Glaciecola siphonariae TaxID=521012 RepID=A0ABV9M0R1_9ALTE